MISLDILKYPVSFLSVVFLLVHYVDVRRRLNHYVTRDIFTGLYNKIFFSHMIQKWIDKGESFYFCVLDIDNFKSINDTYGHIVGDKVILHLAHALKTVCPKHTVTSRFGGDEFVFALKNTSKEELHLFLNKLQTLEYHTRRDGGRIKFTVSIGVCESAGFMKYEDIYREADNRLYISKKSGKGRYTLM